MLSSALRFSYAITVILALSREEEYAKLGPHERVSFDLAHFKSNNQLEFDFLGQHYKVQLRRNDKHLPSLIKTSADIDLAPFSSLTDDNCHYYGHVLEPHQPDGSYLSLSLCNNRGIRGTITLPTNNEQLLILPSAFVSDPQYDGDVGIYNITDPHIVYKERSESVFGSKGGSNSRGLLSRNWRNKVELYVLVDAAWTYLFKRKYSSRWYTELVSYVKELINAASAEYEWWDWGNLGTIEIAMVELEIMGEYSGRYSILKPRFRKPKNSGEPDCRNRDWKWNNYACFNSFTDWWSKPKPLSEFSKYHSDKYGDASLILTGFDVDVLGGLAFLKTMCTSDASAMVDCAGCFKHDQYNAHKFRVKAVAHEIGHIFGAPHTSQVGIMGKGKSGSGNPYYHNGWAGPSIKAIEDYFDDAGLRCLRNGVRSLKITDNSGSGSGNVGGGDSGSNDCIEIKYVSNSYNGEYQKANGDVYMADPYQYLFKYNGKWTLNYRNSQMNTNIVCYKSNVLDCDRYWYVYGERARSGRTIKCGAFTADEEELSCIENNEYDEAICVYNYNNTMANNEWTFGLRRDECYTHKVVYEYDSYLLFYNEDYKYSDDEVMRGRWMISQYEIRVIDAVATCDEEDLLQCFEGKWQVTVATNDTLERITHATMSVSNGYCASYDTLDKKDGTASSYWMTVVCVAIGLLLVVILIAAGCFIYRSRRAKEVQFTLDMVAEESEEENEVNEEEESEEQEVETNLKRTTE